VGSFSIGVDRQFRATNPRNAGELCAKRTDILRASDITEREARVHFFRFAARLTPQEVSARLGDEEFVEAAEILEHINRTPRERTMYDARLKMERDTAACLLQARIEGVEEGRQKWLAKGKSIGKILAMQSFLGVSQSPEEVLAAKEIGELRDLETELLHRLQSRD